MVDQIIQLIDEKLDGPEIGALVGQQGGVSASQLIVVDDGAALAGKKLVGIDIIVGGARAAMKDQNWRFFGVEVAGNTIPGFVFAELGPPSAYH